MSENISNLPTLAQLIARTRTSLVPVISRHASLFEVLTELGRLEERSVDIVDRMTTVRAEFAAAGAEIARLQAALAAFERAQAEDAHVDAMEKVFVRTEWTTPEVLRHIELMEARERGLPSGQ